MEPRVILTRVDDDGKRTLGRAVVYKGTQKLFDFVTMELPWRDNQTSISCIPGGRYKVKPRRSERYGVHFIVENVPERSYILFHVGNYVENTEGCILPGKVFADINYDDMMDVTSSKTTMNMLISLLPEGFILDIVPVL